MESIYIIKCWIFESGALCYTQLEYKAQNREIVVLDQLVELFMDLEDRSSTSFKIPSTILDCLRFMKTWNVISLLVAVNCDCHIWLLYCLKSKEWKISRSIHKSSQFILVYDIRHKCLYMRQLANDQYIVKKFLTAKQFIYYSLEKNNCRTKWDWIEPILANKWSLCSFHLALALTRP